jgi:hypothetical protein
MRKSLISWWNRAKEKVFGDLRSKFNFFRDLLIRECSNGFEPLVGQNSKTWLWLIIPNQNVFWSVEIGFILEEFFLYCFRYLHLCLSNTQLCHNIRLSNLGR